VHWFVERVGTVVSRFPAWCLAVLAVLTLALGALATQQEVAADITEFAPEGELQQLFDRIERDFGAGERRIQVVVDAGPGGNVLGREGLQVAERVTDALEDDDALTAWIAEEGPMGGGVFSYADPVLGELAALDVGVEEATESVLHQARVRALDAEEGIDPRPLLSDDLDDGSARGGLVMVALDPALDEDEAEAATFAVRDLVDGVDPGFQDVDAFSFLLLNEEMESGMEEDLPLLLGISFLLIIGILLFLFRRVSDVILGVVGLVASIVWMVGISVLLGPAYLGLTGAFGQVAIAVPVLLVGLGIDYSVHLSSRYEEERRGGGPPARSAHTAIRTVGVALSLATVTTVIGFAANAVSPLPPIADFGWFAAAGILSAFVVLGVLVPAGRVLLDQRAATSMRMPAAPQGPASGPDPARRGRLLALLPARAPVLTLVVGTAVGAGFGLMAANLDTTFSREEFVPEDSDAGVVLDRVDALFGGDMGEQTHVLVDADVREPGALAAMAAVERDLAEIDDVNVTDGRAEVTSPTGLLHQLDQAVDAVRAQLSARFALLADPSRALEELPLPQELTYEDLPPGMRAEIEDAGGLSQDGQVLPTDDLEALERRLPEGVSGIRALLATLPHAELLELVRAGVAEEVGADQAVPEGVAERLAAVPAEELTYDVIEAAGYPVEDLSDSTVELLLAGDRLRDAGWTGRTVEPDADVDALLAVLHEHLPDQLDGVLTEEAALMAIATRAGETGVDELVSAVRSALSPLVEQVDGEVAVASEQMLIDQTLAQLTDSQTNAIVVSLVAALLLLVLYYGVTARRPALGAITMMPAMLAVPLILGTMWLAGLAFNAMTATVASIAIGIGVPYGIHITNRYLEQRELEDDPAATIRTTLAHTGHALTGSAVTTASGFGVLVLSDLTPIRQFGGVTSVTILYALITALLLESSALVLWDRWHRRRERRSNDDAPRPAARQPEPAAVRAPRTPEPSA
jgi:predicted RND superfamily exporter protein